MLRKVFKMIHWHIPAEIVVLEIVTEHCLVSVNLKAFYLLKNLETLQH